MMFPLRQISMLFAFFSFTLQLAPTISDEECQFLNNTVGGCLHRGIPYSLPCFSIYNGRPIERNSSMCAEIQANYAVDTFRSPNFGGFMNGQGEICLSNFTDQCLLDSTNPQNPLAFTNISCNQGSVSPYYIQISSAKDVQDAFSFAKRTEIRLSIKNSGHDYMGRSSLRGSLALWTRKLDTLSYSSSFVPLGCSASYGAVSAITMGAGANFDDVYTFTHANNVTFIGGYAATVGASGGWILGGGHSVLSPVFGLGIDRVLEFTLVTPDGALRIASACQNWDLFWALRGGGGGTFGVVLSSTHKVEPVIALIAASLIFSANSTNVIPFMSLLVNETVRWTSEGWGRHLGSHNFINVTPLLNLSQAEESLITVKNYALAHNGSVIIEALPDWYSFYRKYVVSNTASVGKTQILQTRLVPKSLFESTTRRKEVLDFLLYMISNGITPYIPFVNPILCQHTPNAKSATSGWRDSIWELGQGTVLAWNSTIQERVNSVKMLKEIKKRAERLTPGTGAYVNEANPWTEDCKEAWWGIDNYKRLLSIKKRYDPDRLLRCWRCVGFEDGDEEGDNENGTFGCFAGLKE